MECSAKCLGLTRKSPVEPYRISLGLTGENSVEKVEKFLGLKGKNPIERPQKSPPPQVSDHYQRGTSQNSVEHLRP